jgi:hypothetical protein
MEAHVVIAENAADEVQPLRLPLEDDPESGSAKRRPANVTQTWLKARHRRLCPKTEVVADRDGLGVRISPKGKLTFQFRYYYDGRPDRVDISSYPRMSLTDAREVALRLGRGLEKGENPKVVVLPHIILLPAASPMMLPTVDQVPPIP